MSGPVINIEMGGRMFSVSYGLTHGAVTDVEKVTVQDTGTPEMFGVFEVQRLVSFSQQDTLDGEDTYCLVHRAGRSSAAQRSLHYGGVRQWRHTGSELVFHLAGGAAEDLGVSRELRFRCPPDELASVTEHLGRLLGMPPSPDGVPVAHDEDLIRVSWVDHEEYRFRALVLHDEDAGQVFQIQRAYAFSAQDVRLGMDTYCLVLSGATHYGGVRSHRLEGTTLHLVLTSQAADDLGMAPRFAFGLSPDGAALVAEHLDALLA